MIKRSQIKASSAKKRVSAIAGKAGVMTIVNSAHNGKRVMFSKSTMQKIDVDENDEICIGYHENNIIVSKSRENSVAWKLKTQGAKLIVYSSDLVKEISDFANLQFADGRVSYTFEYGELSEDEMGKILVIKKEKN